MRPSSIIRCTLLPDLSQGSVCQCLSECKASIRSVCTLEICDPFAYFKMSDERLKCCKEEDPQPLLQQFDFLARSRYQRCVRALQPRINESSSLQDLWCSRCAEARQSPSAAKVCGRIAGQSKVYFCKSCGLQDQEREYTHRKKKQGHVDPSIGSPLHHLGT